jgi:hypothetical protein
MRRSITPSNVAFAAFATVSLLALPGLLTAQDPDAVYIRTSEATALYVDFFGFVARHEKVDAMLVGTQRRTIPTRFPGTYLDDLSRDRCWTRSLNNASKFYYKGREVGGTPKEGVVFKCRKAGNARSHPRGVVEGAQGA